MSSTKRKMNATLLEQTGTTKKEAKNLRS
ncbi:hypothetical protein RDI58_015320 [Solanum bulbocastanum]|uniref:Uncharacterized protein n=1 Tax=Solanum bulbocastanum TaxID=147425 RepID=A0AAN8TGR7_SOLBU